MYFTLATTKRADCFSRKSRGLTRGLGSRPKSGIADLMRRASEPEPDPEPGTIAAILEGLESVGAFDEYRAKRRHLSVVEPLLGAPSG